MTTLVERLRAARCWHNDDMREAADEIERLRALIDDACDVFEHYDLPEHALHYRRAVLNKKGRPMLTPGGKADWVD